MNAGLERGRRLGKAARRGALVDGLLAGLLDRAGHRILDRVDNGLEQGSIAAILPDGTARILGARAVGPLVEVELKSWKALLRLVRSGSAGWYRAWALGEWTSPDPVPLFELFMLNRVALGATARASGVSRLVKRGLHALRRNHRSGAKRNIEFHYDLGNDFYALWLDTTMSYSSALFAEPIDAHEPLEAAQVRKLDALLDRLDLGPDDRLLDIGCGWGALAERAAERGARATGITLSTAQRDFAAARGSGARFELRDYRDVVGAFEAITSVEMVEAVGRDYWADYLGAIDRLLVPGGRAALQYITIADDVFERYAASADFIQTYIFPGGMLLSEREFRALAERQGFAWRDRTGFGQHYAETLRRWRERFDAAVEAGKLPPDFDRAFVDLWRYYLMYCEGGFRGGGIDVAQVTLIKGE